MVDVKATVTTHNKGCYCNDAVWLPAISSVVISRTHSHVLMRVYGKGRDTQTRGSMHRSALRRTQNIYTNARRYN